jgi:hypothetical protein
MPKMYIVTLFLAEPRFARILFTGWIRKVSPPFESPDLFEYARLCGEDILCYMPPDQLFNHETNSRSQYHGRII